MARIIRTGVVGTGFMGQLHCKTYAGVPVSQFVGVYDVDKGKSAETAQKFGTASYSDISKLLKDVEAVSIASSTTSHYDIIKACAENNVHMMVEKPLAATYEQAEEGVKLIESKGLVAAVGYIERFNPAVIELEKALKGHTVLEIDAQRYAVPLNRANDVSAVFDLMIHDIDIVLSLAGAMPDKMMAKGEKLSSPVLNKVDAQMGFPGGCKARIRTSKVEEARKRVITVKCADMSVSADLIERSITRTDAGGRTEKWIALGEEPIKAELMDFLKAITTGASPKVTAKGSLSSLSVAWRIEKECLS